MSKLIAFYKWLHYWMRYLYVSTVMRLNPTRYIFTAIFDSNAWNSDESVSGPGSELRQTSTLTQELPELLQKYQIKSILDIPCGDFNWMNTIDLSGIRYIGADIVKPLIKKNQHTYQQAGVAFQHLNLIEDALPECDLILCRDCLVHFSLQDTISALENICASNATWLLTTHFPSKEENINIITGDWRPLNFLVEPFYFPSAELMIHENCTEAEGLFRDKTLALWRIADIKQALVKCKQQIIPPVTLSKQEQVKLLLKHCSNQD